MANAVSHEEACQRTCESFHRAGADVSTGLELTIPLILLLLDYKVNLDLGGGLDLRRWWW
jgi:hypothetical protein